MKKFLLLVASALLLSAQGFVDPLSFRGTDGEKRAVIEYIKQQVKEDYSKIGMDDPSTLRMMEKKNLDAFKNLVRDRQIDPVLLKKVIREYCEIDMCNYATIDMMYHKELSAKTKQLKW